MGHRTPLLTAVAADKFQGDIFTGETYRLLV